jgi:hypothetical protein
MDMPFLTRELAKGEMQTSSFSASRNAVSFGIVSQYESG